ncbi:MAG: dipeptidase, partial [Clostridiales bacterium]|nr:dipeptidase [Clostridiales bacterium]
EMCRVGIAVDVAHLNDAGIDDVLGIANRPVFASHSNARAVTPHPRCLMDEHIKAIAKQGGVIGVNFYYKQLTGNKSAVVEDVIRHIDHIAAVGGIGCTAIGSDFDGMGLYIEGLETSAGLPLIAERLLRLNYSEADVRRIMFDNLYGYILEFC